MRLIWKIAISIACLALLAAAAWGWHVHQSNVAQAAKLAEEVRVARAGAEQGNGEAQTKLGHFYYYGLGVPQDYSEALRWFKKAADQGSPKGQADFGGMYYYGHGVPQDYATALPWVRKAADQGEPWSQNTLASMYYYGHGTPQDYSEALRWYHKAADQGYAYAEADLGSVYYDGRGVQQDYAEAARWYRKAADQGNARAEFDLGYMDYYAKGVPRNLAEGRRLFLKAADQGFDKAVRTVSCPLTTFVKICLLIKLVGGLFLALAFVRFRLNYFATPQNPSPLTLREKVTAATGILILLSTGYECYCYTHLKFRPLIYGLNGWAVVKWLFVAAIITLVSSILRLGREPDTEGTNNLSAMEPASETGTTR